MVLTDVRVGTHPGFDRITFEFVPPERPPPVPAPAGMLPRYEISRVQSLTRDGSGERMQVAGTGLFRVVFHGATGVTTSGERVERTYTGPTEFRPNFRQLAELEQAGDFEATLSWGFGLRRSGCPRVVELKDPLRLAIDLPH